MDGTVTIYALCDETGVRYSGQTHDVERRRRQHAQARPGWVLRPLATVGSAEADEVERRLIREHAAAGCMLSNWTHTERARREMRAVARGRPRVQNAERICRVKMRLPESVKARLDDRRAREHRSLHAEILKAIDDHLNHAGCGS